MQDSQLFAAVKYLPSTQDWQFVLRLALQVLHEESQSLHLLSATSPNLLDGQTAMQTLPSKKFGDSHD
jgi:hypothetical protein